MYTQCPDCATAFRVTADVLKQAAGKVRCGGCGNAFNALLYLSETKPEAPTRNDVEEVLPELKPEPAADSTDISSRPKKMSAEQSAALLKTLDELAGSDIQLEDTGVEWRLLGESDILDEDVVDEILNDAPTPVDEVLNESPVKTDAGEVFENLESAIDADDVFEDIQIAVEATEVFEDVDSAVESAEFFEESSTPVSEELRFDDNTGLPENFEFEADTESGLEAVADPTPVLEPEPEPETDDVGKDDIALGDPDEWGELLDEVATPGEPEAPVLEAETPPVDDFRGEIIEPETSDTPSEGISLAEELAALPDDDEEPEPDADIPLDIDTQFDLQAEAMGIDLSGLHNRDEAEEPDEEIDLLDTSIEEDLIAAAFESEDDAPPEAETEVELQPEEDEKQSAGSNEDIEIELKATEARDNFEEFELLDELNEPDVAEEVEEPQEAEDVEIAEEVETAEEADAEDFPDSTGELEFELARAQDIMDELEASGSFIVDESAPSHDDELEDAEELDEVEEIVESAKTRHVVPPPSDEEQTLNMQIDRDLMRLAVEDEDGFTSTMVLEGKKKPAKDEAKDVYNDLEDIERIITGNDDATDDIVPKESVETIIMEGDFVRTPLEVEALQELRDSGEIDESKFEKFAKDTFYGKIAAARSGIFRYRVMAGALVLVLLLILQLTHQWRAELARIPAVNSIIGPVYRAFGAPIIPNWDITAWRFEKTVGSTNGLTANVTDDGSEAVLDPIDDGSADLDAADDASADEEPADGDSVDASEVPVDETLTIYSRIGNTADTPLPYPLITVALTDRYEETIGSSVLEPADYLAGNANLRAAVAPGATFDAVIAIESPAADATGFKLNVCYQQAGEQLRCAIEDFK